MTNDTTQTALLTMLKEDGKIILYRPRISHIVGTASAILLQQIFYRYNGKPFYKFKSPCQSHMYKDGDSWCEELGFLPGEFDTALRHIGTKCKKGKSKTDLLATCPDIPTPVETETKKQYMKRLGVALKYLVVYWTDSSHVTWYSINLDLFAKLLIAIYIDKLDFAIHGLNGESQFIFIIDKKATGKDSTTSENEVVTAPKKTPGGDGASVTRIDCVRYQSCNGSDAHKKFQGPDMCDNCLWFVGSMPATSDDDTQPTIDISDFVIGGTYQKGGLPVAYCVNCIDEIDGVYYKHSDPDVVRKLCDSCYKLLGGGDELSIRKDCANYKHCEVYIEMCMQDGFNGCHNCDMFEEVVNIAITEEVEEVLEHLSKYNTGNSGDSVLHSKKMIVNTLVKCGYIGYGMKDNFAGMAVLKTSHIGLKALEAYRQVIAAGNELIDSVPSTLGICLVCEQPCEDDSALCDEHQKSMVNDLGVVLGILSGDRLELLERLSNTGIDYKWCNETHEQATKWLITCDYAFIVSSDLFITEAGRAALEEHRKGFDSKQSADENIGALCEIPQLPIDDDPDADLIDEPTPAPKTKAAKPEPHPDGCSTWDAVAWAYGLTKDGSWKTAKLNKWFTGTIKSSKADLHYGKEFKACQLDEYPATPSEIIAFSCWYRFKYDNDVDLPINGPKLRDHFETFRGAGELKDDYIRKAFGIIRETINPVAEFEEPAEEDLITEEQAQELKDMIGNIKLGD